ncbi:GNAT family N-acetyltransferase [Serinicoccus hydrothermalis]|uniref:GNAT family N-acetyltransferase n=1 Tax=Serinicoccus hydrothermalis TaxID=1758689 RepID=UPI0008311900|nr:GNAT family N-acetyltransferase [Serinicoccus hydrothermalis]
MPVISFYQHDPGIAVADVYSHSAYGHSAELIDGGRWECASDQSTGIVYPYIRREAGGPRMYDTVTPYGYGGISVPDGTSPESVTAFRDAYIAAARARGLVAEVFRLSPLDPQGALVETTSHLRDHPTFLSHIHDVDTEFAAVSGAHRTACRKADRSGVSVAETDPAGLVTADHPFREIYDQTMARVGARGSLRLPDEYYRRLLQLPDRAVRLVLASIDGDVVAGAIFLAWGSRLHYHLSGATVQGRSVQATNAIIEFAKREMLPTPFTLHLGGGLGGDDALARFKSRCTSSNAVMQLRTAVIDSSAFASLSSEVPSTDYFPPWHAPTGEG